MFKKVSLLSLFLILSVLAVPLSAAAQAPLAFASISVDLWPEFDRPNMLVMYLFTLPSSASLPVEVKVRIPADAALNAVAGCEAEGNCFDAEYTQAKDGAWTVLTIQAAQPSLRVEYYDPALKRDGQARSFTYTWPGDFAVDSMKITVQQPLGATDLQIKPAMFNPLTGQDGMNYYVMDAGALAQNQPVTIELSYRKDGDALSSNNISVEASEPLDSTESGRSGLSAAMPIVLGALGVLLIVGGGVWYWRSGRQSYRPVRVRMRQRKSGRAAAETSAGDASGFIYCHQCGKRATAGDRF
ncbi:MAG: hypothetical protein ACKOC5_03640, partial [Chloroflexota bacterium]